MKNILAKSLAMKLKRALIAAAALPLVLPAAGQVYTWCVQCHQSQLCNNLGPYRSQQSTHCGSRRIDYPEPKKDDCEIWTRKQRTCLDPYMPIWWENYFELKENHTCGAADNCYPNP